MSGIVLAWLEERSMDDDGLVRYLIHTPNILKNIYYLWDAFVINNSHYNIAELIYAHSILKCNG